MKRSLFLYSIIALLTSCGGGSSGESSAIEGTWRGDVHQGVILCSDGTAVGAGGGLTIGEVELEVTGTDVIGTSVQAIDGNCYFEGIRNDTGFKASAVSGCDQGLTSISFTLLEDGSAALSYNYDINLVPAGANGIRCIATPGANIKR